MGRCLIASRAPMAVLKSDARYLAARCAALAGCALGEDVP
jgi:hypothetical protein